MSANSHPKDLRSVEAALRRRLYDVPDVGLAEILDLHESNVGRRKLKLTDGEAAETFDAFAARHIVRLIIATPAALDALARLASPDFKPGHADLAEGDVRMAMRGALGLLNETIEALAADGLSPDEAAEIATLLRGLRCAMPEWLANLDARAAQRGRT